MDAMAFLRELTSDRRFAGRIVHIEELPARDARCARTAEPLDERIVSALRRQNIHRLYSHQAACYDRARRGEDVVVVTGTASGKTLCYNLPILAGLLDDPHARALHLFPTKALTQDQHGKLQTWAGDEPFAGLLRPAVYDGDTPAHNRPQIRRKANVICTNPDMLHVGILPYHGKWHEFLRGLRYVVVDELHTYRGIFGSHVAGVLRRLLRMCEHYGSRPTVLASSATIANPLELGERLIGREMTLVDDDGAPRGRKHFALWNPPFLDDDQVSRRSANIEAVEVLTDLIRRRAQTILFGKARIVVELCYKYAVDALRDEGDLARRIRPYRGGYLPVQRREIERMLFAGELLAVTATNALELGIDVGALDAAVLVGFPGTICSTWQQAGRAGRTSQESLVLLIAYNDPIDQYVVRHPDYLFGAPHENAVIDPFNPHILSSQLSCACFEKPVSSDDERYFGPLAATVVGVLAEEGDVKEIDGRHYWRTSDPPAPQTNLRTISPDTYAIVDGSTGNRTLGNVDSISAPELVYPGAVYLHEGESFVVRSLDTEAKVARVAPAEVDYYTQPVLSNACRLAEATETRPYAGGTVCFAPAEVTWRTTAFRKVRYYTMELIGQDELDLPAQTLATTAMAWRVGEPDRAVLARAGFNPIEGLMGVRNLMLASLPALAMCDRRDISGQVESSNFGVPTIIVYDRYSGGLGFAQQGFERMDDWLDICRQIVGECPCRGGCPSCVGLANLRPPIHHDPDLGAGYPVPNKDATVLLLETVAARPEPAGERA